ncbi:hypothetical protein [Nocardia sp. BMG51109]|uniref:hypothetical protein n=1 Tax=Nocardia sp. BMG51109 TaxID=1056816 RepID=UPI0004BB7CA3|nr:hypothetical protein [Nocardia sp. BMG51109]
MNWRSRERELARSAPTQQHTDMHTKVEDNAQANLLGSGVQCNLGSVSITVNPPQSGRSSAIPVQPLPTEPSEGFVGRKAELRTAISFVSSGHVIPIVGPEHAGKSAFITTLMSEQRFRDSLPQERQLGVVKVWLPGPGSEAPLARALAAQFALDLDVLDDDGNDTSSIERRARHKLHELLIGMSRDRDLVVVINCTRFTDDVTDLESDLDDILANPAFEKSVVLIVSTTNVVADGGQQLRLMPPIRLGPLKHDEAVQLLSAELAKRNICSDADEAVRQANDDIAKRPKIILLGVDEYSREIYDRDPRDEDPERIALALLEACGLTITTALANAGIQLLGDSKEPDALALLMVWSLTEQMLLPPDILRPAGLGNGLEFLVDHGVLAEARSSSSSVMHFRLSTATQVALRNLVAVASGGRKDKRLRSAERNALGPAASNPALLDTALSQMAYALFDNILRYGADDDEGGASQASIIFAVECAVGWISNHASGRLPRLSLILERFANSLDITAIVLPVVPTARMPMDEDMSPAPDTGSLYHAVSVLNVTMREPVTDQSAAEFVTAGRTAADLLVSAAPLVPTQMLRSIDNALFFGGRRFGRRAEVLTIRRGVCDLLRSDALLEARDQVSRLTGVASWLLNTVVTQVDEQQMDEARTTASAANQLLGLLPPPRTAAGTATLLRLRMQAAKATARMATTEEERLTALAAVVSLATTGLENCASTEPFRQLWTNRFLDGTKFHALEFRQDQDRVRAVESARDVLAIHYGPIASWDPALRVTVAKFELVLHRENADPELVLDGAKSILALLKPVRDLFAAQAMAGYPAGLLQLALAKVFMTTALLQNDRPRDAVGEAKEAVQIAETAVTHGPAGTDVYRVWLKCLGILAQCEVNASDDQSGASKRRQAVVQIKAWLQKQTSSNHRHAQLAFLCIEEEWYQDGRSLQLAARKAIGRYNEPYDQCLRRIYMARTRTLKSHERRYGPTVGTLLAHADVERQYRQLLTTTAKGQSAAAARPVDNSTTWSILDRAAELYPYSDRVRSAKASVFRRLWQYDEAVEQFEAVIRLSTSGHRRRVAQINAAEVLLTSVRSGKPVQADHEEALRRAADHLVEPLGHNFKSEKVHVLRARIALEAGDTVDWSHMNTTFARLFDGGFPTAISTYLNQRRLADAGQDAVSDEKAGENAELSKLLYDNFTDTSLIAGLGHLYLRQAELLGVPDRSSKDQQLASEAARRAYDCFDASRVVLEARYDNESTPNRFNRARAICLAAALERTVDPFPLRPLDEKSWLDLALKLYESARARSVAAFHDQCHQRYLETQGLLRLLTNEDNI